MDASSIPPRLPSQTDPAASRRLLTASPSGLPKRRAAFEPAAVFKLSPQGSAAAASQGAAIREKMGARKQVSRRLLQEHRRVSPGPRSGGIARCVSHLGCHWSKGTRSQAGAGAALGARVTSQTLLASRAGDRPQVSPLLPWRFF